MRCGRRELCSLYGKASEGVIGMCATVGKRSSAIADEVNRFSLHLVPAYRSDLRRVLAEYSIAGYEALFPRWLCLCSTAVATKSAYIVETQHLGESSCAIQSQPTSQPSLLAWAVKHDLLYPARSARSSVCRAACVGGKIDVHSLLCEINGQL